MSRTLPRSIHTCCPGLNHVASAVTVLAYVAVPEKYFTPASALSVHDVSAGICTLAGAPKFAGKLSVHGPATVVSFLSTATDAVRAGDVAALRKITNTDSRSARSSGITVNPPHVAGAPALRLREIPVRLSPS